MNRQSAPVRPAIDLLRALRQNRTMSAVSVRNLIDRLRDPRGNEAWLDPRSHKLYVFLVLTMLIEAVAIGLTAFELGHSNIVRNFLRIFVILGLAAAIRRLRFARVAVVVEAAVILTVAGALAVTGTVLLAAVSGSFVDRGLDAADHAIGFDFLSLLSLYRAHPCLAVASRWVYATFALQALLVPAIVALFDPRRFWLLVNAWTCCLAIAVMLFPLFPAAGPFVFHGVHDDVFPNLLRLFPWETGPAIEAIRRGEIRDIGLAARGFISIPSFHAVGGVLFAWAAWPSRWLRWPMVLLNAAMVASAVVTGSHYLIDLIVGGALAAAVLLVPCFEAFRLRHHSVYRGALGALGRKGNPKTS